MPRHPDPHLSERSKAAGSRNLSKGTDIEPLVPEISVPFSTPFRTLDIYHANAGYELRDELDFLTSRAMEPNIFFSARFLAPAMPRIEDKPVRLMIVRDDDGKRSRMRFLMPFAVERPGIGIGPPVIRAWANQFGPLGTPLLDAENAVGTIEGLIDVLHGGTTALPGVLVIPELPRDGPFACLLRSVALARNLPMAEIDHGERPILQSDLSGPDYLARAISTKHRREHRRLRRKLAELGSLSHEIARSPADIRYRIEEFLTMEASGWKGNRKTALAMDRYRAPFAREAATNLAENDNVRIHTLDLDGNAVASLIVFLSGGTAYTWKTAYDETYSQFSPGQLLVEDLTCSLLDDPNIELTDSCAVHDHPVMSRTWMERRTMCTFVLGFDPSKDRDVRQVAQQLQLNRNTRDFARKTRERLRRIIR